MATANARIDRVHGSWRVRVFGHRHEYFADRDYGGKDGALKAARAWRDKHWDGTDRRRKLSNADRAAIRRSKEHYMKVAAKYGISPTYVYRLRRET